MTRHSEKQSEHTGTDSSPNGNSKSSFRPAISRRNALRIIGAGSALGSVGVVSGTDSVRIPIAKRGNKVAEWKKVPQSWNEHRLHANKVIEGIRDQYYSTAGVEGIGLTHNSSTIEGMHKLEILLETDSDVYKGHLATSVDGINIRRVEAPPVGGSDGCYNNGSYSNVPGGVVITGADGGGTTCCKVKDNSGKYYMLTASHLWDEAACNKSIGGKDAYQNGTNVGYIHEWNKRHDWVGILRDNSGVSFDNTILRPSGREAIRGYITRQGLSSWGSDPTYKMGTRTGETVAYGIYSHAYSGGWECHDFDGKGVVVYNNQAKGDSGCPVYALLSSGPYMISMAVQLHGGNVSNTCGAETTKRAGGYSAYAMSNNAGFRFAL